MSNVQQVADSAGRCVYLGCTKLIFVKLGAKVNELDKLLAKHNVTQCCQQYRQIADDQYRR